MLISPAMLDAGASSLATLFALKEEGDRALLEHGARSCFSAMIAAIAATPDPTPPRKEAPRR